MRRELNTPVSVLMPVCNETDIIAEVVEEWHRDVFQFLADGSELVFDDGASTDGTLEKLYLLQAVYPYIRIIHSQKDGFAASARRLYRAARCPLIFFTDSDGQYVPGEFWKVARYIEQYDFVHGAKSFRQDPLFRRVASKGFNALSNLIFASGFGDINSAFRLMRKSLIDALLPRVQCMPTLFNAELLLRAIHDGYTAKQVMVRHRPRKFGESRGLPPASFLNECMKALRGLIHLRREVRAATTSRREAVTLQMRES